MPAAQPPRLRPVPPAPKLRLLNAGCNECAKSDARIGKQRPRQPVILVAMPLIPRLFLPFPLSQRGSGPSAPPGAPKSARSRFAASTRP
ncbi:hypothetical protein [Lysobacter gummosus]|uniref:hypothetical protein n=1 Tax=Lysobacter gummosus TaxID=262324 RepID=UPI0036387A19